MGRRSEKELTNQALGALMSAGSASLATFTRAVNDINAFNALVKVAKDALPADINAPKA